MCDATEETDWPRVLTPPYTPLLLTPLTDSSQSSNGSVDVPLTPMNCTQATRPKQPELALAADDDSDDKRSAAAKLRDESEQKLSADATNNDAEQSVHNEQSEQEEKFSVETNQSEQEIPTKMIVGGVLVGGVVVVVGAVTAGAGFAATAALVCVL